MMKKIITLGILFISFIALPGCAHHYYTDEIETSSYKYSDEPPYLIGPSDIQPGDDSSPYPMDRTPRNYLRQSAVQATKPHCPTQAMEDDFGRPTQGCVMPTGEAIFLQ